MPAPATLRQSLASTIRARTFVTLPGVFDMISARIADQMDFDALYMTGYGTVASHLGLPDAGLATYTDMLDRVTRFCQTIEKPLIADGDTGYGGLLNVDHTVKGYEGAGAAGIQLEDQLFPKKCGHTPGRQVIPLSDARQKIQVAAAARDSRDFLIVARTDAREQHGLDDALRRGDAFAEAGADILFIEAPQSVEEMARIGDHFRGLPLLANMVEGGTTPVLPAAELESLGYTIALYPTAGFLAMASSLRVLFSHIKKTGSSAGAPVALEDFGHFSRLMGFQDVWDFEALWQKDPDERSIP